MAEALRIDPEFESKIPPLTEEEYQLLEENILQDGVVLNPLIVWNGCIVDGHNRFRIIQAHPEIKYTVFEKEFPDRYAAIAWICCNQLGRRNLTPQQKKYLIGQRYEAEKQTASFHGNQHTLANESGGGQNVHHQKVEKTAERIARECHSSLNHTGVYLVKQDRMLLHLEFPWVSIASDASPREQLRYYREYRGLLRRELGDMTGMSETTILNYELGYMPIAYDKAKRLAKALEIDEKLLFDDYCRFLDYPFQLRCKELRLELGLTQVEIADKAGIARGTYGTWECAAVRPGREPFQKFAAFITSQGKEVV